MKKVFEVKGSYRDQKMKTMLFESEEMAIIFIEEMTDFSDKFLIPNGMLPLEFKQPTSIEPEEVTEEPLGDIPRELLREMIPKIAEKVIFNSVINNLQNLN